jgi:ABC-type transport system involved in multi-copper enzyme maturation permease subunit
MRKVSLEAGFFEESDEFATYGLQICEVKRYLPGILTIAKKEFTDHVSDNTFLLSFAVLLIVMVAGAYVQVLNAQDWAHQETLQRHVVEQDQVWKVNNWGFTDNIAEPLSTLGVFVAIALSFNSINKERTEGSLKVLLSYPISKAKLIIGKLLGGLLVISLVVVASMTISFSIVMYFLSIPVTTDFLQRIASVTSLGIVLLFFFLCIGTAISIIVHDTSAALMGILLAMVALRPDSIVLLLTIISNIATLAGVHFRLPPDMLYYGGSQLIYINDARSFWVMSPIDSFLGFSTNIFQFQNISGNPPEYFFLSFEWLLPKSLDLAESIIVFAAVSLIVCCILFMRSEATR